jgi:hypothetical protein
VSWRLPQEVSPREPAQLPVDERDQLVERRTVSASSLRQQLGYDWS